MTWFRFRTLDEYEKPGPGVHVRAICRVLSDEAPLAMRSVLRSNSSNLPPNSFSANGSGRGSPKPVDRDLIARVQTRRSSDL